MTCDKIKHRLALRRYRTLLASLVFVSLAGCLSVPPEVVRLHLKEQEIINDLRVLHLALADAYMEKKLEEFERFFFHEYGPVFRENWLEAFKTKIGRPYDPEKDWSLFSNDLIGEYQNAAAPIAEMRTKLRDSIAAKYRNALDAHQSLGDWIDSLKKLSDAQRRAIDQVLGSVVPGLSLADIDNKIDDIKEELPPQNGAE